MFIYKNIHVQKFIFGIHLKPNFINKFIKVGIQSLLTLQLEFFNRITK